MEAHCFQLSTELKVLLEEASARAVQENKCGRNKIQLVGDNKKIMKDGGFQTEDAIWHEIEQAPVTQRIQCPVESQQNAVRFPVTEMCVADCDTLTAALVVGNALALNFANAEIAGGGYLHGASAQEEDLCRCLPQLHPSLAACKYPIQSWVEALVTQGLSAVRRPRSHSLCSSMGDVHMVTAAMPCNNPRPGTPAWQTTVRLRIRAVLHAAKVVGLPNIILGAFGCGAFGNPPEEVAQMFKEQLVSPEFRGQFEKVVFAIIDTRGNYNVAPFTKELRSMWEPQQELGSELSATDVDKPNCTEPDSRLEDRKLDGSSSAVNDTDADQPNGIEAKNQKAELDVNGGQ